MRKFLIASAALFTLASAPSAMAAGAAGAFGGITSSTSGSFSGDTASGFSTTFGTQNGGMASFSSAGVGANAFNSTLTGASSVSAHAGSFQANSLGNGFVSGSAQTDGEGSFKGSFGNGAILGAGVFDTFN